MTARAERIPVNYLRTTTEWTVRGVLVASVSLPIIYSLTLPLMLLDLWVSLYQRLCFPLLGIAPVPRGEYVVLDRHLLPYLNPLEKANCGYCGYANGAIAFVRDVAARTEQYWCPIQHARPPREQHARHRRFAAYGDERAYQRLLPELRLALRDERARARPRVDRHHCTGGSS